MIGSKQLTQFTSCKMARFVLSKKAKARESTHEPVEKRRINVKFSRNSLGLFRVIPSEVIKDAKLDAGIEDLAAPPPINQI